MGSHLDDIIPFMEVGGPWWLFHSNSKYVHWIWWSFTSHDAAWEQRVRSNSHLLLRSRLFLNQSLPSNFHHRTVICCSPPCNFSFYTSYWLTGMNPSGLSIFNFTVRLMRIILRITHFCNDITQVPNSSVQWSFKLGSISQVLPIVWSVVLQWIDVLCCFIWTADRQIDVQYQEIV